MKVILVCKSVSHGNTARIAQAMSQVLGGRVVDPADIDPAELADCDLVGFGSGIFNMSFHPDLRRFIAALPTRQHRKAFVFRTSGLPETPFRRYVTTLTRSLEHKGFEVIDSFGCRGFDTVMPLRLVGGIHKSHPDAADIAAARAFAENLRVQITTPPF
ncbi:flavodoxin family protein [Nocardia sp. NPDC058666]|uniref:flavodoxin family protein n=1 Tax=Nocardia sp. NPDC058666 TaxID=3346587 RepID=UPI0036557C33